MSHSWKSAPCMKGNHLSLECWNLEIKSYKRYNDYYNQDSKSNSSEKEQKNGVKEIGIYLQFPSAHYFAKYC